MNRLIYKDKEIQVYEVDRTWSYIQYSVRWTAFAGARPVRILKRENGEFYARFNSLEGYPLVALERCLNDAKHELSVDNYHLTLEKFKVSCENV